MRSRSRENLKFGHFMLLFCRGRQRNVPKCKTHVQSDCLCSLSLLFCGVLVAVAVLFVKKLPNCDPTVAHLKHGSGFKRRTLIQSHQIQNGAKMVPKWCQNGVKNNQTNLSERFPHSPIHLIIHANE